MKVRHLPWGHRTSR